MQSALEKEIVQLLIQFRSRLASHDRGVLIGLLFAIPPIPPVPLLGLFISLFNYWLWKQHKLEAHEIGLIRWALVLSVISSALAVCLIFLIIHVASMAGSNDIIPAIIDIVKGYFHRLMGWLPFHERTEVFM
jgi:hypothetical protein